MKTYTQPETNNYKLSVDIQMQGTTYISPGGNTGSGGSGDGPSGSGFAPRHL